MLDVKNFRVIKKKINFQSYATHTRTERKRESRDSRWMQTVLDYFPKSS